MDGDLPEGVERRIITSRDEWLLWRLQDVTASDVGALFSAHPYRTLLRVWAEKSGLAMTAADNAVLRRGRWAEASVIEMLGDERPTWTVRRSKVYLRLPDLRLGATPDAAAIDPARTGIGCVQCKTVRRDVYERDWLDDQPPLWMQLQTLVEAMLMGADWAVVAALVMDSGGGWEPIIREVPRHVGAEARIRAKVSAFWADFEAGLMPVVDPTRDAKSITELYPKPIQKEPIDLSTDNALQIDLVKRARMKRLIKMATDRVERYDTDLKAKMNIHERAIIPGWRVSWKTEHVDTHVVQGYDKRVLRVLPDKSLV